jgi:hypothetical protein
MALKRESVTSSWNALVINGAGKDKRVMDTIEQMINPTTSLSRADQIYPRRIAAFRAQATKGSGV